MRSMRSSLHFGPHANTTSNASLVTSNADDMAVKVHPMPIVSAPGNTDRIEAAAIKHLYELEKISIN